MAAEMTLRGFMAPVSNLRGRMRLCHPVLSPDHSGKNLFVARHLKWSPSGEALEPINLDDVSAFGTLWPGRAPTIAPGDGVAIAGSVFWRQVSAAIPETEIDSLPFSWNDDLRCWTAIAGTTEFRRYAQHLIASSRTVFDQELQRLNVRQDGVSEKAAAALFVLRRAPGRRDTDVAVRELASARVRRQSDLYRRLLAIYSVQLGQSETVLDERATRHVELARVAGFVRRLPPRDTMFDSVVKTASPAFRSTSGSVGAWHRSSISRRPASSGGKSATALSQPKMLHKAALIRAQPLEIDHTRSVRLIEHAGSSFRERTYERKRKGTGVAG